MTARVPIPAGKALTENGLGAVSHEGVGDSRVVLSYSLVRGLATCSEMVDRVLQDARAFGGLEWLVDLLVMTMQTRDCREGKGERDLTWQMLMCLAQVLPKSTAALVRLLPKTFGSWKDVRTLYGLASMKDYETGAPRDPAIVALCVSLFKEQLVKDASTLSNGYHKDVSLCAKWAPREGCASSAMSKVLGNAIFQNAHDSKRQYRHLVAKLNRSLETVEVKMCGKRFREISPAAVPAAALKRYRKAFLDVQKHRDDEDRLTCARNFKMHALNPTAEMHGATLFPHELLVASEMNSSDEISLEIIQKQWEDLVRKVKTSIDVDVDHVVVALDANEDPTDQEDNKEVAAVSPLGGKYVPLVDVSGSMAGTPMDVAVAMGILMSEIAHPAFKHRFLSFHSTPQWVELPAGGKLNDKIRITKRSPWGMSTNFLAAIELILEAAKAGNVAQEDMPQALFVFSDMQFDQAQKNRSRGQQPDWDTGYEKLQRQFVEAGYGHAPLVVFWNLRSGSDNMPVKADQQGVVTCSGYSPSLLKFFMEKDLVKEMEKREEALKRKAEAKAAADRAAEEVETLKAKMKEIEKFQRVKDTTKPQPSGWASIVGVDQQALEEESAIEALILSTPQLEVKLAEAEMLLVSAKMSESEAGLKAEETGMTPMAMMRTMLDHERYSCVRELPDADQEIGLELENFLRSSAACGKLS